MKLKIKKDEIPVKTVKYKYIYISLFIVLSTYTIAGTAMQWKSAPDTQDQVQSTLGVVGTSTSKDGATILSVLPTALLKDTMYFGCAYNMSVSGQKNQCLSPQELKAIDGELANVSWYEHKGLFGIKNPYKQMVSIEVNGKYLKSLNETKVLNDGYNNARGVITSITLLFYFVTLQLALFLKKKSSRKDNAADAK